VGIIDKN